MKPVDRLIGGVMGSVEVGKTMVERFEVEKGLRVKPVDKLMIGGVMGNGEMGNCRKILESEEAMCNTETYRASTSDRRVRIQGRLGRFDGDDRGWHPGSNGGSSRDKSNGRRRTITRGTGATGSRKG